jgi:integrase
MQTPKAYKHGRGWRGRWREGGKYHWTAVVRTRGEALTLVKKELDRIEQGDAYVAVVTFGELCDRFLAAYQGADATRDKLRHNLKVARERLGDEVLAQDVSGEAVLRWFNDRGYKQTYRAGLMQALRQTYNFGVRVNAVRTNPLRSVSVPKPRRGTDQLPFESWDEVYTLAHELGQWGALLILAVDSGARPGELRALEHRHVEGRLVYLPGTKTESSRRKVTLTSRGEAAYRSIPRFLGCPFVFHGWRGDGVPLSDADWRSWTDNRWRPALRAAGLQHRKPYNTRHTFAYFALRAGVPINTVAQEMGHDNVQQTYGTYGKWADEIGERAAQMREQWAAGQMSSDSPNAVPEGL